MIFRMRNERGFEEECCRFRQKYNIDFGEFEKRFVSAKEGKFDLWDDYMAWKFAENGRIGGDKRTGELKNVLQDP